LFAEIGKPGVDLSGSPEHQLDSLAKARRTENPKLSYAQAYAEVLTANPDLYTR
jgi:hypothetical protein